MTFEQKVRKITDAVADLLVEKNKSYGDTALNPVGVFSKLSPEEGIKLRIDDKLSRLKNGKEYGQEDTVTDLIGYLIFLKIVTTDWEGTTLISNDGLKHTSFKGEGEDIRAPYHNFATVKTV